jgi:hypothetical protein
VFLCGGVTPLKYMAPRVTTVFNPVSSKPRILRFTPQMDTPMNSVRPSEDALGIVLAPIFQRLHLDYTALPVSIVSNRASIQTGTFPFYTLDGYTYQQCKLIGGCAEPCNRDTIPAATQLSGDACRACVGNCFDLTATFPFYTLDGCTYAQCRIVGGCSGTCS